MGTAVLYADVLNLPEEFDQKFKGKKVELIEKEDSIIIKPVYNEIDSARGMFKGGNFSLEKFMRQKQAEKALEYGE